MAGNFVGFAYSGIGLAFESANVKFSPSPHSPSKLDPSKCRLKIGEANPSVSLEDTITAAVARGVGTELPPDQEA